MPLGTPELGPRVSLILAPIDDYCQRLMQTCIYKFDGILGACGSNSCNENNNKISLNDAIDWTTNYRNELGVSKTDSIVNPCGQNSFMAPLAFDYNTESFFQNFDTTAQSDQYLFALLALEPSVNPEYKYEFKIVYGAEAKLTKPSDPNAKYVDFASPCPIACGDGNDPLLGD